MNDAQREAARRVLDELRKDSSWPRRGHAPKRGGAHDCSIDGERACRVLFTVDGRRVALAVLDQDGDVIYQEAEPWLARRREAQ